MSRPLPLRFCRSPSPTAKPRCGGPRLRQTPRPTCHSSLEDQFVPHGEVSMAFLLFRRLAQTRRDAPGDKPLTAVANLLIDLTVGLDSSNEPGRPVELDISTVHLVERTVHWHENLNMKDTSLSG